MISPAENWSLEAGGEANMKMLAAPLVSSLHPPSSDLPPIAGYHPTTLIDWPGRLAAVLFLPQCNLRCRFCHAGSLLSMPEERIPLERVLDHLAERRGWLDGVVICGGEPTLWPTLPALCQRLHDEGLAVKLDTNGTHPARLAELLEGGLVDAVAMDLKAPLDDRYESACGRTGLAESVRKSIRLLMASGREYEFRTTVCPTLIGPDEIHAMGREIRGARRWILQRFEPAFALDPELRAVVPYSLPVMQSLAALGRQHVASCQVRGQPETAARH
jgi:pyruvate formate lyase activating enzyme